jgi:integrase/recombinase XerD
MPALVFLALAGSATTTSHEQHTHGEPQHHRQDRPDRATSCNRSGIPGEGIRSGEAFALDVPDIDTAGQVLTVTGKHGRTRLIALHPTAAAALAGYLQIRARHAADDTSALLIGHGGHRLNHTMARQIFRSLASGCGLAPHPGRRLPRLHDFRHAFAVSTLIDAHRQSCDVDARIAVLATHLGHINPAHTYWYLTVTPALTAAVAERAALYYQAGSFR